MRKKRAILPNDSNAVVVRFKFEHNCRFWVNSIFDSEMPPRQVNYDFNLVESLRWNLSDFTFQLFLPLAFNAS